ncbi:MAG: hypothetical protein VYD57_16910 [Pseudomonadota bacterium]|nr:hypothetical protein [Pseudomonadota bacterium]
MLDEVHERSLHVGHRGLPSGSGSQIRTLPKIDDDRRKSAHITTALLRARSLADLRRSYTTRRDTTRGRNTDKPAKLRQKDRDARWTLTFSKVKPAQDRRKRIDMAVRTFGDKNHIAIDRRHGFIRGSSMTNAAAYDGAQRPNVLDKTNTGSAVWADTAFRSKKNEEFLREKGFNSDIHRIEAVGK